MPDLTRCPERGDKVNLSADAELVRGEANYNAPLFPANEPKVHPHISLKECHLFAEVDRTQIAAKAQRRPARIPKRSYGR